MDSVFPDAAKLLCQLQIQRNFEAHLKKLFVNPDSLDRALGEIKSICASKHCDDLERYLEAFKKLAVENTLDKGKKAMEYLDR
jgi:hypothetical protein